MPAFNTGLSRIDKLFVERDAVGVQAARVRREAFRVAISCGPDIAGSYTLQLAALTAAALAMRCFPNAVSVVLDERTGSARLLVWDRMDLTIRDAFRLLGVPATTDVLDTSTAFIVVGDAPASQNAMRITFDGWIAKVGPSHLVDRLEEREYCPLAGILGASLAISELFLSFADISLEAGRRAVALSLWRPKVAVSDPSAVGVRVEFLPRTLWVLGLGHLGNSYLWTLASLRYTDTHETTFYLNDYDFVERENVETGVLFARNDVGALKTRICAAWLEARGFGTRLVERAFDANFRRHAQEPALEPILALCGFDSNPVRRNLATAGFLRVVESGLGSTASNFDTLSMHTLPHPRPPEDIWPDLPAAEVEKRVREQERMARENCGYLATEDDECGRYELAGKAVGVPFVGMTAATLVVAETLRLLHGGPAYNDIKMSLGTPGQCHAQSRDPALYTVGDLTAIEYATAVSRAAI